MRKKKHPEHVNHERWLVSYADFITLLFAFFVVMFAVSQVDSKRLGRFTEAFSKAVGITLMPLQGQSLMNGGQVPDEASSTGGDQQAVAELDGLKAALLRIAQNNNALAGLQIIQHRHELVLRLPESVLFDTGEARVKDTSTSTLKVIAPELRDRSVDVRVEGHTDNVPISKGRFRSNWELSTTRAIAVMLVLSTEGIQDSRVSVAGYGEFRPVASNATEDGRKQNRRVDLVITLTAPPEAPTTEPANEDHP
jgi:chemotaxis protein MotB